MRPAALASRYECRCAASVGCWMQSWNPSESETPATSSGPNMIRRGCLAWGRKREAAHQSLRKYLYDREAPGGSEYSSFSIGYFHLHHYLISSSVKGAGHPPPPRLAAAPQSILSPPNTNPRMSGSASRYALRGRLGFLPDSYRISTKHQLIPALPHLPTP